MKPRTNWHRHDYSEYNADLNPIQTGTPVFLRELRNRHFKDSKEVVKYLKGKQLTLQYLQTNGFENPIVIDEKEGLNMTVPPSSFSVFDVENYIGKRKSVLIK